MALQIPHIHPLEPRRLLSAGDLDPTFSAAGHLAIPALSHDHLGPAVLATGNDKFLIIGPTTIQKYDSDAVIDRSFGDGGAAGLAFATISDAEVDTQGRILIAGKTDSGTTLLLRFTPDGVHDSTAFGNGGTVNLDPAVNPGATVKE